MTTFTNVFGKEANGREGVAIALLLIFAGLNLFNSLAQRFWPRDSPAPVGGSQG